MEIVAASEIKYFEGLVVDAQPRSLQKTEM